MHNTVVPRLIRNKSLPVSLTEMTEKNELKFSYEYSICILKESRRIVANRCRNDSEYSTKTTNALANRTHGREPTRNQKEKMDGNVICTTVVSRTVREIPFGIDMVPSRS